MIELFPYPQVEQIQEKIVSLELTKPDELKLDIDMNGKDVSSKHEDDEESVSEPPTPTTDQEKTLEGGDNSAANKKRRKRRSKKGKH